MALDKRTKELVAIGASIGSYFIPCLKWHYKNCISLMIPKEETKEAIDTTKLLKRYRKRKFMRLLIIY